MDIGALAPAAYKAMIALDSRVHAGPLPAELTELVKLRASQINGCAYCVDSHSADAAKAGTPPARLAAVGAWEEGPFFSPAERAAFALTESMTRLSEGSPRVPDEVWADAAAALRRRGAGPAGHAARDDQRLEPDRCRHPDGARVWYEPGGRR